MNVNDASDTYDENETKASDEEDSDRDIGPDQHIA